MQPPPAPTALEDVNQRDALVLARSGRLSAGVPLPPVLLSWWLARGGSGAGQAALELALIPLPGLALVLAGPSALQRGLGLGCLFAALALTQYAAWCRHGVGFDDLLRRWVAAKGLAPEESAGYRPGWAYPMAAAAQCAAPTPQRYQRRRPERTPWFASSSPTSKPGWSAPAERTVKHRLPMSSGHFAAISNAAPSPTASPERTATSASTIF